jgi:hypothetical protein
MASDYSSIKNSDYMRKLDPLTAEAFGKAARGELSQPESMKLAGAMALLGEPGRQASEGLFRFLYHQKGAEYGATKPDTLADMNKALMSGTLTVDKVLEAYREPEPRPERHADLPQARVPTRSVRRCQARQTAPVAESLRQLSDLIEHPYLEQGIDRRCRLVAVRGSVEGQAGPGRGRLHQGILPQAREESRVGQALFAEQHKQIEELRDSVAKSFGGPTMADFLKATARGHPEAEPDQPDGRSHPGRGDDPGDGREERATRSCTRSMAAIRDLSKMLKFPVEQALTHELLDPLRREPRAARSRLNSGQAVRGDDGVTAASRLPHRRCRTARWTSTWKPRRSMAAKNLDLHGELHTVRVSSDLDRGDGPAAGTEARGRAVKHTPSGPHAISSPSPAPSPSSSSRVEGSRLSATSPSKTFAQPRLHARGSEGHGRGCVAFDADVREPLDLYTRGPEVEGQARHQGLPAGSIHDAQLQIMKQLRGTPNQEE